MPPHLLQATKINSNSVAWKEPRDTFLIKQQKGGRVGEGREGGSPTFPSRHIITPCNNQEDCPEMGCFYKRRKKN